MPIHIIKGMKLAFTTLVFVILLVTFAVAFEPSSQMTFNLFVLKKFGPIHSIDSALSLPERPSSIFVPANSVTTKNGRSVLTLVKTKGLFALEYTNLVVQLGETQGTLVEIVSPKMESDSKIVTLKPSPQP